MPRPTKPGVLLPVCYRLYCWGCRKAPSWRPINSTMSKRKRPESAQPIASYEAWLTARGVTWDRTAVKLTATGVVAGMGCVAAKPIRVGQELCRIPRAACLGAAADADVDDEPPEADTQSTLATLILEEQARGEASEWAPLLRMLSPAPCPTIWPAEARSRHARRRLLRPAARSSRDAANDAE